VRGITIFGFDHIPSGEDSICPSARITACMRNIFSRGHLFPTTGFSYSAAFPCVFGIKWRQATCQLGKKSNLSVRRYKSQGNASSNQDITSA
jgi:hypothetical protein